MKCTDFENRLNELLDDRLAPQDDASVVAHASGCADCREVLAAHEGLFRGLALLSRRTVSPELGKKVLREFNSPGAALPPLPPAPRRGWLPMLATAAAILLAVGLSIWIVNRNRNPRFAIQPAPRGGHGNLAIIKPSNRTQPKETLAPAPLVAPQPPQVANVQPGPVPTPEENEAYRQTMASLASQWSANGQWSANPQWPHVETLNVEQYAPGIRPIRESFEVALDALLRTIPSGKKETRPTPPQALQPHGDMIDLA
jgi:hypothetical protein